MSAALTLGVNAQRKLSCWRSEINGRQKGAGTRANTRLSCADDLIAPKVEIFREKTLSL